MTLIAGRMLQLADGWGTGHRGCPILAYSAGKDTLESLQAMTDWGDVEPHGARVDQPGAITIFGPRLQRKRM